MEPEVSRLIHLAALVSLLTVELEKDEIRRLANDRLRTDLRGLQARVDDELEVLTGRRRLRLADGPSGSVGDD